MNDPWKQKIIVVVAEGRVQSVLLSKSLLEADVEVCDFDSTDEQSDLNDLADYVDKCREEMREVRC